MTRLIESRGVRRMIGVLLWAAAATASLRAQPQGQRPPPHLGYAYPAGGQTGTTFTVTVGGQNLNGTEAAFFSRPGVTATVKEYARPMTQKEFNDLRDQIRSLQDKRAAALGLPADATPKADRAKAKNKGDTDDRPAAPPPATTGPPPVWTPEDQRLLAALRAKAAQRPNRQGNPAIAENVTLDVTIAADVRPGDCELRLRGPTGLSNPLRFELGTGVEYAAPAVTASAPVPPPGPRDGERREIGPEKDALRVTPPIVLNGQILPAESDRFQFEGKKGQRLTAAVSARTLLPYLADAVPGWFQATLTLQDSAGRELAYSAGHDFDPDPLIRFELPRDDVYTLAIKDALYRGREDFVYRIALAEQTVVTSGFPPGGAVVNEATLPWEGPALATDTFEPAAAAAGSFVLAPRSQGMRSSAVRAALEAAPVTPEAEPNDTPAQAQTIDPPRRVEGRIGQPGDADLYAFAGKAGHTIVAEIVARRLGSPLDSRLALLDAAGRVLAANDDHEDKGAGLMTHHADSQFALTLPADGTYWVSVTDNEGHGGPAYAYRLRVGPPQPDFELRVVPSAINARPGGNTPVTVYALRRDGFDGEIALGLADAPGGFALAGARIPAGQERVQVTLSTPRRGPRPGPAPAAGPVPLTVVGTATLAGQRLRRMAVPADDLMQAFAYHHLVPAHALLVDVTGPPAVAVTLVTREPLRLARGGSAIVALRVKTPPGFGSPTAELNDAPPGLRVTDTRTVSGGVEITIRHGSDDQPGSGDGGDVTKAAAGNLVVLVFAERPATDKAGGRRNPQRVLIGTSPAIPYEVAPAAR